MQNYTSLSKQIAEFEYESTLFRRSRYLNLYLLPLFYILGFLFFLMMVKKRNQLKQQKEILISKLNDSSSKLSLEDYIKLHSRILSAGKK